MAMDAGKLEMVRRRPGMYVGSPRDAALNLLLEVLANACDQSFVGRCSRVDIELAADGTMTVTDDGPGLPVHCGDGLPSIEVLLTRYSDRPTVDGHQPHVHMGRGGIGLFAVNALSERFELATVRDGIEARAVYVRGELVEPLVAQPTARPSGTVIRFRPDSQLFPLARVSRVQLSERLEDLAYLLPRLQLSWRVAGDDVAASGLTARVAIAVECPLAEVASYRGSFTTPSGPIDVDLALAWREDLPAPPRAVIDSFVNLERMRMHGTHVDGLIDGIVAFLGGGSRSECIAGLVAAVAVTLADVKLGTPMRDRLDSPEARAPVAEATQLALTRWAEAYPEAAAALRARK